MIASLGATSTKEEDAAPAGRRGRAARAWLVPGLLGLAWLVVLLAHLRVPAPSDQLNYMLAARRFPDPVTEGTETHQLTRFGLVVPAALAVKVFGYSQAAYAVVPVLATLSLLLGTYALGTLLFSRPVGVAAGVAVVAATPVFNDSTDLLPDVLAVGLFTCALAIAVAVRKRDDPPSVWVLVGLGALLGWSYMTREFIVFLWPVIPVLLWRRAGLAGLAWTAAPIVVLGVTELLLCWRLYGDPLARLLAITGHGSGPSRPEIASTYRDKPRMMYVLRLPNTLRDHYPEGGLLVAMIGATLLGALAWPRRLVLPAALCALFWVPLTLLGGVIDPSAPKLRLQLIRYWFPIFPAFVLGGLAALWLLAMLLAARLPDRGRVRVVLPAVAVLAAAAVVSGVAASGWWATPQTRAGGATQMEAFRGWMHDRDGTYRRVWTDPDTRRILAVYRSGPFGGEAWRAEILVSRPGKPGPAAGDLVVFYDTERGKVCPYCKMEARRTWGDTSGNRPGWRQVFATPDRVLRVFEVSR
ncbi:glycosyltransferase family 39 protein [Actinomadura rugatobispora]|uniref:Glycosyltransferase family 39 protein n=1 Tax=Actinomadura rugatobispora TaxID=1994 RepID=A0ABW1A6C8_9ACTN|nr:hypothetical protein GCM10010200_003500 [Actinomadura rugatobispora]